MRQSLLAISKRRHAFFKDSHLHNDRLRQHGTTCSG